MSINFSIYWSSSTNECTPVLMNHGIINSRAQSDIMFVDGSKARHFFPSSKYNGSVENYVFQMGPEGLGYYIDPMVVSAIRN
jgi:hypothetical protein